MERFDEQFDGRGADPATLEVLWVEADDMRSRHPCRRIIDTWTQDCTPTPSEHRGMGSNVEQWRGLVSVYFPDSEIERALCIMARESGGNPEAKNPTSSARGLMQILASLWAPHFGVSYEQLYDPETNIRLAREIWDMQGWRAWSPYKRGLCR